MTAPTTSSATSTGAVGSVYSPQAGGQVVPVAAAGSAAAEPATDRKEGGAAAVTPIADHSAAAAASAAGSAAAEAPADAFQTALLKQTLDSDGWLGKFVKEIPTHKDDPQKAFDFAVKSLKQVTAYAVSGLWVNANKDIGWTAVMKSVKQQIKDHDLLRLARTSEPHLMLVVELGPEVLLDCVYGNDPNFRAALMAAMGGRES